MLCAKVKSMAAAVRLPAERPAAWRTMAPAGRGFLRGHLAVKWERAGERPERLPSAAEDPRNGGAEGLFARASHLSLYQVAASWLLPLVPTCLKI